MDDLGVYRTFMEPPIFSFCLVLEYGLHNLRWTSKWFQMSMKSGDWCPKIGRIPWEACANIECMRMSMTNLPEDMTSWLMGHVDFWTWRKINAGSPMEPLMSSQTKQASQNTHMMTISSDYDIDKKLCVWLNDPRFFVKHNFPIPKYRSPTFHRPDQAGVTAKLRNVEPQLHGIRASGNQLYGHW